jgi:serine/threonine-protein kinase
MVRAASNSTTRECPSAEVLRAFGLGDLPDELFDTVADHVAACTGCEAALDRLSKVPDSLMNQLRRLDGDATVPQRYPRISTGLTLPMRLGRYELLEVLGEGGMGVVYKARQERPNRLVAVKMVLGGVLAGSAALARLRTEVEAAGRLQHPAIVQVFDYGEQDGRPYFVMEHLSGGSLARRLREGPLLERSAAELVRTLARAIHTAHQQRVVHRDLKPANVLLSAADEPKIADFGLAVLLDGTDRQTENEAVLGTPAYMAPEQARGDVAAVGPLSDVYGLGAILYEALTGQAPFRGASRASLLRSVRTCEPVPPSRLRHGLSPDLEAVCLRCLSKEPGQRYASAADLADDLTRWLEGRPTVARPLGRLGRMWRAVRRRPLLAVALLTVVCAAGLAPFAVPRKTEPPPPPDPDRPAKEIEARLAAGEKVVLLGDRGGPTWQRWCQGGERSQTSVSSDGTFSVHAWEHLGRLELVRRPPCDRYRLRAEMRHDKASGQADGEVGLYCANSEYIRHGLPLYFFAQIHFNDWDSAAAVWDGLYANNKQRSPPPPPRPLGNKVRLFPHISAMRDGKPVGGQRLWGPDPDLFQPMRSKGVWRTLELEVTPEAIRAWWIEGEQRKFIGEMRATDVKKALEAAQDWHREHRPEETYMHGIGPTLDPRGGLGLLVSNSSASFRRVTIEPLPPS